MYFCIHYDKIEDMKIKDVVDYLDEKFRPELQEDYDNAGFLLGNDGSEYRGSLVAIDLTPQVANEAIDLGLNLIVTHHPLIFGGARRLTSRSELGRTVAKLIKHDVAVYAAHTNLDNLPWGVNDALAKQLGLQNCRILKPMTDHTDAGSGMVGELAEPLSSEVFLARLKRQLGTPTLRTSLHTQGRPLKRVALCGGSGASLIGDAIRAGADLYVTADLKYHDFQRAEDRIILVDAGHYETEQFAKEIIFRVISEKFSTFACRISASQESIVGYI